MYPPSARDVLIQWKDLITARHTASLSQKNTPAQAPPAHWEWFWGIWGINGSMPTQTSIPTSGASLRWMAKRAMPTDRSDGPDTESIRKPVGDGVFLKIPRPKFMPEPILAISIVVLCMTIASYTSSHFRFYIYTLFFLQTVQLSLQRHFRMYNYQDYHKPGRSSQMQLIN